MTQHGQMMNIVYPFIIIANVAGEKRRRMHALTSSSSNQSKFQSQLHPDRVIQPLNSPRRYS